MDPISNVDRLVMVLRQRILDRAKGKTVTSNRSKPQTTEGLAALAAIEAVDDQQLRRALIQSILADQFGEGLINDTKFQQVVERVTDALSEDEKGAALLNHMVAELKSKRIG